MIRHVVLLRFAEDGDAERIADYISAVVTLQAIPGVVRLEYGPNVTHASAGVESGDVIPADNWDFAVSVDFRTYADYGVYAQHPVHRALIENYLQGLIAGRAALKFVVA